MVMVLGRATKSCLLFAVLALLCAPPAYAHGLGILGSGSLEEAVADLDMIFGGKAAFAATLTVIEKDQSASEARTREARYFVQDRKLRVEWDSGKNINFPKGMIEHERESGVDRTIEIARPDTGMRYTVYPRLKGFIERREPSKAAGQPDDSRQVQRIESGRETAAGHPCIKYDITVKEGTGEPHRLTVWEATDIGNFPVQVMIVHGRLTTTLRFSDIKRGPLKASLFGPPPDCKRYDDLQQLLAASRPPKGR